MKTLSLERWREQVNLKVKAENLSAKKLARQIGSKEWRVQDILTGYTKTFTVATPGVNIFLRLCDRLEIDPWEFFNDPAS